MINLLQKSLDRRRIVQGGVAAGAAMAFNPFSGLVSAQEAEDLPTDASDMDALIAGAQKENKIVSYGMPATGPISARCGRRSRRSTTSRARGHRHGLGAGDRQVPGRGGEPDRRYRRHRHPVRADRDPARRLRAVQERHLGPDPRVGEAPRWSLGRPVLRKPGLSGQHRSRRYRAAHIADLLKPDYADRSASTIPTARRRATSPSSARRSPTAATRPTSNRDWTTSSSSIDAGNLKSTEPDLANLPEG